MKRLLKAAAFALASIASTAAYAQNSTLTNHAFAIGKGPGTSGYTPLLCTSAQLAVGQTAADPICRTITGDWTLSAAGAAALANVNSNAGTFGSATSCVTVTNNAKGLTTAISAATCAPAIGSVTGLGTGVAAALAVNVGTAGAPLVNGGVLGTPSSGNGANITNIPIGSITGLGTGVPAALAVNVGTAGAPVVNGGALGTPVSGVGTNFTGTAVGLTAGNATLAASATKLATARAIGIGGSTGLTATGVNFDGTAAISPALTGTLAVANGGTGDTGTAWATYTPSIACNTGSGTWTTNSARFKTIGKTVFVQIDATLTTLGTCTSNGFNFQPPGAVQSSSGLVGREVVTTGSGVFCSLPVPGIFSCSLVAGSLAATQRFVASGVYESQ